MPYKRPGSQNYQIRRRNLIGFGDTGVVATGTRDKRVAQRMEAVLDEIAHQALLEPRWRAVLDALKAKKLHTRTSFSRRHSADWRPCS